MFWQCQRVVPILKEPNERETMVRNMASAKKAGSAFETLIAEYLAMKLADIRIERRVKSGAKDRGDIAGVLTVAGGHVVIEAKNQARDGLPQWIKEAEIERKNDDAVTGATVAGVVAHKKHGSGKPGEQYVTMTLETFAVLLRGGSPELRGIEQAKEVGKL
jgi:hypothetical protein